MPVNFELITVAAPPTLPKPPCASPAVLPGDRGVGQRRGAVVIDALACDPGGVGGQRGAADRGEADGEDARAV